MANTCQLLKPRVKVWSLFEVVKSLKVFFRYLWFKSFENEHKIFLRNMGAYLYMLIYECICILHFMFLAAMKNTQQDVKELNVYFA